MKIIEFLCHSSNDSTYIWYNETNKQKQKTKIMESQEIQNARISFAKEDISILMESGVLLITDTINGLLDCEYFSDSDNEHNFIFKANGHETKFTNIQGAQIYLEFSYSVG